MSVLNVVQENLESFEKHVNEPRFDLKMSKFLKRYFRYYKLKHNKKFLFKLLIFIHTFLNLFSKSVFLRTFLITLCCSNLTSGNEIACDNEECFGDPCCLITETAISSSNFTISGPEDDTVRLFDSSRNRNVEFLPIRINERFPNLVTYLAERCVIREISKTNFEYLFHLRVLNLNGNKLEIINTDRFDALVSLESLMLGKIL